MTGEQGMPSETTIRPGPDTNIRELIGRLVKAADPATRDDFYRQMEEQAARDIKAFGPLIAEIAAEVSLLRVQASLGLSDAEYQALAQQQVYDTMKELVGEAIARTMFDW